MEIGPNLQDLLETIICVAFFAFLIWRVTR